MPIATTTKDRQFHPLNYEDGVIADWLISILSRSRWAKTEAKAILSISYGELELAAESSSTVFTNSHRLVSKSRRSSQLNL